MGTEETMCGLHGYCPQGDFSLGREINIIQKLATKPERQLEPQKRNGVKAEGKS